MHHGSGRFDDRHIVKDGEVVGWTWYACADYVKPSTRWWCTGPRGFKSGFRTRKEAENYQLS